MSRHFHSEVANRRSIALNLLLAVRTAMVDEAVDLVAGDLHGRNWRERDNQTSVVRGIPEMLRSVHEMHQKMLPHPKHPGNGVVHVLQGFRSDHHGLCPQEVQVSSPADTRFPWPSLRGDEILQLGQFISWVVTRRTVMTILSSSLGAT